MHLTKHHGLGNDFCVTFVDAVPAHAPALARSVCHRTRGIGADGLIFATPADGDVDAGMHLFNADGSAAAISGNGIRCLAQALWVRRGVSGADVGPLAIASAGRVYRLDLVSWTPPDAAIAVDMGPVTVDPRPVDLEFARPELGVVEAATASIGNPHLIIQVERLDAIAIETDGPALEARWLPEGINVHFMVATGPDAIELLHWERGAGVTAACGSGASVAATVANRWGLVGDDVSVTMPGGNARVRVGEHAILVGPAVRIAAIDIEISAAAETGPADPAPTNTTETDGDIAIHPDAALDTAVPDRG